MTGISWEYLHPLTQRRLSEALYHRLDKTSLDCGCYKNSRGSWHLCAYHEGFDEGAEAADHLRAAVAEQADAPGSSPGAPRGHEGSTPSSGTG